MITDLHIMLYLLDIEKIEWKSKYNIYQQFIYFCIYFRYVLYLIQNKFVNIFEIRM